MKKRRIISFLVLIMVLTSIITVIPVCATTNAEEDSSTYSQEANNVKNTGEQKSLDEKQNSQEIPLWKLIIAIICIGSILVIIELITGKKFGNGLGDGIITVFICALVEDEYGDVKTPKIGT